MTIAWPLQQHPRDTSEIGGKNRVRPRVSSCADLRRPSSVVGAAYSRDPNPSQRGCFRHPCLLQHSYIRVHQRRSYQDGTCYRCSFKSVGNGASRLMPTYVTDQIGLQCGADRLTLVDHAQRRSRSINSQSPHRRGETRCRPSNRDPGHSTGWPRSRRSLRRNRAS